MTWAKVLREFEMAAAKKSRFQAEYHGAYDKLLNTLFPTHDDFTVRPSYMPGLRSSADFLLTYQLFHKYKPVLVLEIKRPGDLPSDTKRRMANDQIRGRLKDMRGGFLFSYTA